MLYALMPLEIKKYKALPMLRREHVITTGGKKKQNFKLLETGNKVHLFFFFLEQSQSKNGLFGWL